MTHVIAAQLFLHGLPTPLARVCQRELSHLSTTCRTSTSGCRNPKTSPQLLLDNGSTYLPGVLPWFPSPPSGALLQERGYRVTVPCRGFHGLRFLLGCLLIRFRHISTETVLGIPADQLYALIYAGIACLLLLPKRNGGYPCFAFAQGGNSLHVEPLTCGHLNQLSVIEGNILVWRSLSCGIFFASLDPDSSLIFHASYLRNLSP
jgi:hypothetical protein